jgi:hypothetical protein
MRKGAQSMEGTVALVLVITLVVGGMMLALVMGYRDIEASRAERGARASKAPRVNVAIVPGFFAAAQKHVVTGPAIAFDEALLARLEQHVKAEHDTVAQFVHYPSLDSLYRKSESSLHVH